CRHLSASDGRDKIHRAPAHSSRGQLVTSGAVMRTWLLAITSAFYLAPFAEAQSTFPQNQLNQLNARHSSSFYTGQREASRVVNQAVPRYNFSNVNQGLLKAATGGSMSSRQKPFSQVQRGPSTSPYMGLISDNPF